jgi:hypothetical protein
VVLKLREYLRFKYLEDGTIETQAIESGDMYGHVLKLDRGFFGEMTHEVNSLSQKTIYANG